MATERKLVLELECFGEKVNDAARRTDVCKTECISMEYFFQ